MAKDKAKGKGRTGRPHREINWETVDAMLSCQATEEEICAYLDMGISTLKDACKRERDMTFQQLSLQKRKIGHVTLRRKQVELALDGSIPMLIFLGKQWLGQSDRDDIAPQDAIAEFRSLAGPPPKPNGEVKGQPDAVAKRLEDGEDHSS